jgi:hypothetical protein
MDFDIKNFNIILDFFQMKIIFQQNIFFQHTYVRLNGKLVQFFLFNHMSQKN